VTTYTFDNVISIKVSDPPLDADVLFVFPDTYPGGQTAAEAYAQNILAGDTAALDAMTAERDIALAERDEARQQRDNIMSAWEAEDTLEDADEAVRDSTRQQVKADNT
jgi:hypothetical protein